MTVYLDRVWLGRHRKYGDLRVYMTKSHKSVFKIRNGKILWHFDSKRTPLVFSVIDFPDFTNDVTSSRLKTVLDILCKSIKRHGLENVFVKVDCIEVRDGVQ